MEVVSCGGEHLRGMKLTKFGEATRWPLGALLNRVSGYLVQYADRQFLFCPQLTFLHMRSCLPPRILSIP